MPQSRFLMAPPRGFFFLCCIAIAPSYSIHWPTPLGFIPYSLFSDYQPSSRSESATEPWAEYVRCWGGSPLCGENWQNPKRHLHRPLTVWTIHLPTSVGTCFFFPLLWLDMNIHGLTWSQPVHYILFYIQVRWYAAALSVLRCLLPHSLFMPCSITLTVWHVIMSFFKTLSLLACPCHLYPISFQLNPLNYLYCLSLVSSYFLSNLINSSSLSLPLHKINLMIYDD